jgi:hypothetical protein
MSDKLIKMVTINYFANILLTADHPMGRMHAPKRKKGDWFHSISVFADKNINSLPVGGSSIKCSVIHFYGHLGGPVLDTIKTSIKCVKKHMGKKLYIVKAWSDSIAVIGDIRTIKGYEPGHGSTDLSLSDIKSVAIKKWGNENVPYAHQRNESYNCVAFVDDILVWAATKRWNRRIEKMHAKHGLHM